MSRVGLVCCFGFVTNYDKSVVLVVVVDCDVVVVWLIVVVALVVSGGFSFGW